jgi:hypothetical protein
MVLQVLLWLIVKGHVLKVRSILRTTFNNTNKTGKKKHKNIIQRHEEGS